jgi:hypothetical protein
MKTAADFKRDMTIGKPVILRRRYNETAGNRIGTKRFLVKSNSVGFELSENAESKSGSFMDWPKTSLLEYDGKTATIYQSGLRPLTAKEKEVYKGQPQDAEQQANDIMTDGSTMFYRQKAYFKARPGFMHLFGCHRERGMLLKHGTQATIDNGTWSDWFIDDDAVKGEIGLVYEILD